jgi:hypothetical protein
MESFVAAAFVRQRLGSGGRLKCRVVSGSMEPVIAVGEAIEVERLPLNGVDGLKRFDIVLYDTGEKLVCHYFWGCNRHPEADGSLLCLTRSLDESGEDLPVPTSSILGRVTSHRLPWHRRAAILAAAIVENLRAR